MARANADSVALAKATLAAAGTMTVEFGRESERVKIEDRIRLMKSTGRQFLTEPLAHTVSGDTTLLKDMYTFKDPKGNPREQMAAELAGLSFGSDFLSLLRILLAGAEGTGCTLRDSAAVIDGASCYLFTFATEDRSGRFWIDRDSLGLRRMEVEQASDYLVGSYKYRMTTDYRADHPPLDSTALRGVLLPVRSASQFEYSRLTTSGTGSILVMLDSIRRQ